MAKHAPSSYDYNLIDDKVVVHIRRPKAERIRAGWTPGTRVADYRRFFAFYIDLVTRTDFALQKDSRSHDRMLRDGQLFSALRIRQLATASRGVSITPKDSEPKSLEYANKVSKIIEKIERLPEVLLNILDAIPRGLSVQEIVWTLGDDLVWYPTRIHPIHASRVAFDTSNNLVLRSPVDIFYGEELPPWTFIHHVHDPEPGDFERPEEEGRLVFGHGLLDRLYPWWLWKSILLRLQLRSCERSASGAIVGRYPWKNREAQQSLIEALDKFDNFSRLIWPSGAGFDVEVLKSDPSTQSVFDSVIRYIDEQIAKMILGTTLLIEVAAAGSFAMSEVHERTTFGKIVQFDASSLISTLRTQLIRYIFEMNNWDVNYLPNVVLKSGPRWSLTEVINALDRLIAMGYSVSYEVISEETGIRPASPGESVITLRPLSGEVEIVPGPGGPIPASVRISTPSQLPEVMDVDAPAGGSVTSAPTVSATKIIPGSTFSYYGSGNSNRELPIDGTVKVRLEHLPNLPVVQSLKDCATRGIVAKLNMRGSRDYFVEPYAITYDPRAKQYVLRGHNLSSGALEYFPLNDIVTVTPLVTTFFVNRWKNSLIHSNGVKSRIDGVLENTDVV